MRYLTIFNGSVAQPDRSADLPGSHLAQHGNGGDGVGGSHHCAEQESLRPGPAVREGVAHQHRYDPRPKQHSCAATSVRAHGTAAWYAKLSCRQGSSAMACCGQQEQECSRVGPGTEAAAALGEPSWLDMRFSLPDKKVLPAANHQSPEQVYTAISRGIT